MKLPPHNAPSVVRSLSMPVIGVAASALLHVLLWAVWPKERPPQPETKPAQVIEVALMAAQSQEPPTPEIKPPPPPPPTPKTEKPPEKAAPKKVEKPKPKPAPRKEPRPEPSEAPAVATPAAPSAVAPASPQATAAPAPQPYVAASYKDASLKNPPTRYPALALERRWEGRVVLNVQVLPDGSAGEVRVASSSGHEILDDATVEQVKNWRFIPARRGDQAVASWVTLPIEYKLKH